jgi:hypothetical protein
MQIKPEFITMAQPNMISQIDNLYYTQLPLKKSEYIK